MTEHIDDVILVVDNDEGVYDYVRDLVGYYEVEGPTKVGERIKDYLVAGGGDGVAAMMLAEFMGSVSSHDLGYHYIDAFRDEEEEDEEE